MSWLGKQIVDQSAHFIIGACIGFSLYLIGVVNPYLTGAFTGLCVGMSREITQHNGLHLGKGSYLDIFFWVLGSCIGTNHFFI